MVLPSKEKGKKKDACYLYLSLSDASGLSQHPATHRENLVLQVCFLTNKPMIFVLKCR